MAFALFWRNRQICCKQKITGHSTTGQIQDSPLQGKSVGANGIHPINGTKPPESPFFKGGFFCGVRFKSNHPPTPSLNRKEGEQPVGAGFKSARSAIRQAYRWHWQKNCLTESGLSPSEEYGNMVLRQVPAADSDRENEAPQQAVPLPARPHSPVAVK